MSEREKAVKRIKKLVERLEKMDLTIPLWSMADVFFQQIEYHEKVPGTSGESPDFEKGFLEGLKNGIHMIEEALNASLEDELAEELAEQAVVEVVE